MTNPTTPPTDALQKARELKMEKLLLELQSYLSKVHPKRIFTVIPEIASHLRSQASELERVTAERDAALKGYREMRECMKNIPTHEMDEAGIEFCLGCNEPYQHGELCWVAEVESILTSFPEIK